MRGFKSFESAHRFCRSYGELCISSALKPATTSTSVPTVDAYFTSVVPALRSPLLG